MLSRYRKRLRIVLEILRLTPGINISRSTAIDVMGWLCLVTSQNHFSNRNRNLQTSNAPLKSQAQGTSLFWSAEQQHAYGALPNCWMNKSVVGPIASYLPIRTCNVNFKRDWRNNDSVYKIEFPNAWRPAPKRPAPKAMVTWARTERTKTSESC